MFVAQLLPELFYGAFGACCRQRPPTWTDGPGTRAEPQASGRAGERPVGAATGALSPLRLMPTSPSKTPPMTPSAPWRAPRSSCRPPPSRATSDMGYGQASLRGPKIRHSRRGYLEQPCEREGPLGPSSLGDSSLASSSSPGVQKDFGPPTDSESTCDFLITTSSRSQAASQRDTPPS